MMNGTEIRFVSIILVTLLLYSCGRYENPEINGKAFSTFNNQQLPPFSPDDSSVKMFMFMSPDCPLSVNYTKPYSELKSRTDSNSVQFFLVYPGEYHSEDEILDFQAKYFLDGAVILDHNYKLSKLLKATITPQVIILNPNGEKVYTGAFDNWAYAPGRKRQQITEHYAEDALNKVINGDYPEPLQTEPIGCFIEY